MEYLQGDDLSERVEASGAMSCEQALELLLPVLDAFSLAHERGVIHRDVKSANILLVNKPGQPDQPKVLDFGIARIQESGKDGEDRLTRTGTMLGSLAYVSPEQAMSQQVDARTDIYSLGIVLYEMVTGTVPFKSDSTLGILSKQVSEIPALPSRIRPDARIHPAVERAILRCLQKTPDRRYASAAEMKADLVQILEQIRAGTPTSAEIASDVDALIQDMIEDGAAHPDEEDGATRAAPSRATKERLRVATGSDTDPTRVANNTNAVLAEAAPRRSIMPIVVLGALGLLGVAAVVLFLVLTGAPDGSAPMTVTPAIEAGEDDTRATSGGPSEVQVGAGEGDAQAAPDRRHPDPRQVAVNFILGSTPPDAKVRWKDTDETIGTTPLILELTPALAGRVVIVEREGFMPYEMALEVARLRSLGKQTIQLIATPKRQPAPEPAARRDEERSEAAKPSKRPASKRPGRRAREPVKKKAKGGGDDLWEDL